MTEFISYRDIKDKFENSWHVPYEILLKTLEWQNFRETIISRDKKTCIVCGKEQSEKFEKQYYRKPNEEEIAENLKEITVDFFGDGTYVRKMKKARIVGVPTNNPVILHVHHKHYVFGYLPWEYEKEILMTVCHNCRVKIHKSEIIPVFVNKNLKEELNLNLCSRCKGTGFLDEFHYFQNGICFRCDGRKFEEFITV